MSSSNLLRQAIEAARAGRKAEARDLLLKVVEIEPRSEIAWMWLSGLVDSLEDRIIACENVLTINPANERARVYLRDLQRQKAALSQKEDIDEALKVFNQAKRSAAWGDTKTALHLARQVLEKKQDHKDAWLLIARISPDINEQVTALEQAASINPSNKESALDLKRMRDLRANPLRLAQQLEQEGKISAALEVYKVQAAKAKEAGEFDEIYRQIVRIERLQQEKIHYVSPASSIARLTCTWPLTYLFLVLVQVGLNPFAHPALILWLGLPSVALGSFLLALAEVRSRHIVWRKVFSEHGDGSRFARIAAATAGSVFIIVPHLLLLIDSLNRLYRFTIPPTPFPG